MLDNSWDAKNFIVGMLETTYKSLWLDSDIPTVEGIQILRCVKNPSGWVISILIFFPVSLLLSSYNP